MYPNIPYQGLPLIDIPCGNVEECCDSLVLMVEKYPRRDCYCYFIWDFFKQLVQRKERNALFTDALNILYLWLYGIGHMVKDHSDSERKPATTWATLSDEQQGFFYLHHPTDRIAYTMAFFNQSWSTSWNEK